MEAAARLRSACARLRRLPPDVNEPLRMRLHLALGRVEIEHILEGLWQALGAGDTSNRTERLKAAGKWRGSTRAARRRARWHLRRAAPLLERHGTPKLCAQHQVVLGRALMWHDSDQGLDLLVAATHSFNAIEEPLTAEAIGREIFAWLLALGIGNEAHPLLDRLDPRLLERLMIQPDHEIQPWRAAT